MKETYEKAVIELELFQAEDVILTSPDPMEPDPGNGGLPGM